MDADEVPTEAEETAVEWAGYQLNASHPQIIACSVTMDLGPSHVLPLPAGAMQALSVEGAGETL